MAQNAAVDMATANKLLAAGYMTQKQYDTNQKLNEVPPVDMLSAFAAPKLSAKMIPDDSLAGPVIGENFDPPGKYSFQGDVITPNLIQGLPPEVAPPPDVQAAPVVAPAIPAMPLSGLDIQTAGITQTALAAQQQALNDQKAYADIVTEQKKIDDARKSKEDAALTAANAIQKKQVAAIAELAATKISPDNYWANKSTGQKIGIGIALIAGAFGAANTGKNSAVEVIDKAIDQDLDTQKANYAAKKGAVGEMDSAYAKLHGVYKDELAATSAAKAELLNQAMIKLQSNAAKFKGDAATAAATSALGQLQSLKDAETLKLQQSKAYGEDPQFAGMDDKTRERYIPKSDVPFMPFGVASIGSKEDVSKFRTEANDVADAISSLQKLEDMTKLGSIDKFSPAQKAAAEVLQQTTVGKLRAAVLGPGIINEQERAIMERMIANPTDLLSLDARNVASLTALRNSMTNSVNRKGVSLGLKSAAPESLKKTLGFKPNG
jgi:hypothetical protein